MEWDRTILNSNGIGFENAVENQTRLYGKGPLQYNLVWFC
jgi:hypothetical protein